MKLITHNMLSCHIKGVKNGFPFKIQADKVGLLAPPICPFLCKKPADSNNSREWLCVDLLGRTAWLLAV